MKKRYGGQQYFLPLFRMNEVPGHSTGIISWLEIPVEGRDVDGDDETSNVRPLEPGLYMIDGYINGIYMTPTARAQHVIEIRS